MTPSATATPTGRPATEHTLTLPDGSELFYRAWIPATPIERAMLLIHRGHEHSGRWQETVERLGLDDVAVFALDARGHGRSSGERGSAPNVATLVHDLDLFVQHLGNCFGVAPENIVLLGHSVGAVIAAAWVHDYGPPIRGLILATPAFRVKLYVPFAIPLLRLRQRIFGPGFVQSYVKARMLTHDPEQARSYDMDDLIFRRIAVDILLDLHDTGTRLLADAGAIMVPTLVLTAGSDWVVRTSAQRQFFERLSSRVKRWESLPGFYHAIFHERDRERVIGLVRDFTNERFAQPMPSHEQGDIRQRAEFDHPRGPRSMKFAVIRSFLKTVGRLSQGIRLGWQTGFDSGRTLDYVYANRVQGWTFVGRWIDRAYLNSIGWRGIRARRQLLEGFLQELMERLHADGQPVRLLDIAAGPGRYVLETLARLRHISASAVLRDYQEANLEAARKRAQELGLSQVTIAHGEAFDRASLAAVRPRPTLAVVSGLYELFPDNEYVLCSLHGIADALEPGGYLIYTNQPWHPQVEFIARVLINREGKPWVMRCRSQAEMDDLVRQAGFVKRAQKIDPQGIFTVSVAQRRPEPA